MRIEHRIQINASAGTIYRIYEDIENWHTWDPDTRSASLDGPFAVGSNGTLTPTKGNSIPIVVTLADPARGFTVEAKVPLIRMLFEHELIAQPGTTEVIHRVTLSGLLALFLGPLLSRQLNSGLPVTLSRLKALAEMRNQA